MKYISLMFLIFISIKSNAQYYLDYLSNLKIVGDKYIIKNSEKVNGVIIYQQQFNYDSTDHSRIKVDTMGMSFSDNFSDYRLESMRLLDSIASIQIKSIEKKDPKEKANINYPSETNKHYSKERFLCDGNTIYQHKELYEVHYLLVFKKEKETWNIEDSTKVICGFICQKAGCFAFGRHYTAWFTTDLPYSFGPRTIYGLPGIIMEAYDDSNQIKYLAIKVFTKNDDDNIIGLPEKPVLCTKKEFDAMMEVVEQDPTPFLKGEMGILVGRNNVENGSFKYKKRKESPKNAIELKFY